MHLEATFSKSNARPSNLPSDKEVSLRKLAGGVTITDNAAAAVKQHLEIGKLVAVEVEKHHGPGRWAAFSVEQREMLCKVWGAHCHRHLGNTFLDGGCAEENKYLRSLLEASLAEASSRDLR